MLRIRSTEAMRIDSRYAYLKYHRWTDENEGTFECKMKTFINYGLLLFNGGWKRYVWVNWLWKLFTLFIAVLLI